jgi:hypothetical protein
MCFQISPRTPYKKFTWKPITCYKYVQFDLLDEENTHCRSTIQHFEYEYNKIYKIKHFKKDFYGVVLRGFHSYIHKYHVKVKYPIDSNVTCIIPAFSFYYVNKENNEYVSNRIKILKPDDKIH